MNITKALVSRHSIWFFSHHQLPTPQLAYANNVSRSINFIALCMIIEGVGPKSEERSIQPSSKIQHKDWLLASLGGCFSG
jgi:hypothetical protein